MEWLKVNDDGEVEILSEEVKLVPKVQALLALKYNKGKGDIDGRKRYRGLAELKYMYLAYSPKSPYRDFLSDEAKAQAREDCSFPEDWKESEELQDLIVLFKKGSNNKTIRLLNTVNVFLEKFEKHLNSLDLTAETASGAWKNNPKEIIGVLEKLPALASTLQELEAQAKMDSIRHVGSKGDHQLGWMAERQATKTKQKEDESDNNTE